MKQEALQLVKTLNEEATVDGIYIDYVVPFSFKSTGDEYSILFMGIEVWSSTNGYDQREVQHEPLRDFVLKEVKVILTYLNQIMEGVRKHDES